MELLSTLKIDYYTRWDNTTGKGHETEPHWGKGTYSSTNVVLMIAFENEAPLALLTNSIKIKNESIKRPSDKIRLFVMPMIDMV